MERLIDLKTKFDDKEVINIVDKLSKKYNVLLRIYNFEYHHIHAFVSFDKLNYVAIPIDHTMVDGFLINPFLQIEKYLENKKMFQ